MKCRSSHFKVSVQSVVIELLLYKQGSCAHAHLFGIPAAVCKGLLAPSPLPSLAASISLCPPVIAHVPTFTELTTLYSCTHSDFWVSVGEGVGDISVKCGVVPLASGARDPHNHDVN